MRVCGGIGSGVCFSLFMVSACYWRGRLCFGRGRDRGFVLYISPFLRVLGWWVCVCLYTRVHTHKLLGYLMWAKVLDGHLESQKNPDWLKRIIHVDHIGVHSTLQITVSHFSEHKRLHLESSKQNYYIISLRAIIQAIFTSPDFLVGGLGPRRVGSESGRSGYQRRVGSTSCGSFIGREWVVGRFVIVTCDVIFSQRLAKVSRASLVFGDGIWVAR